MNRVNPVIAFTGLLMMVPGWASAQEDVSEKGTYQDGVRFDPVNTGKAQMTEAKMQHAARRDNDDPHMSDDIALFDDGAGSVGQNDTVLAWDKSVLRLRWLERDDPVSTGRGMAVYRNNSEADAGTSVTRRYQTNRQADFAAAYRLALSRSSSVSGYLGNPGYPALGPGGSTMESLFSLSDLYAPFRSSWMYAGDLSAGVVTVGYAWRNFQFESSSFSRKDNERADPRQSFMKMDSQSRRLSFRPAPDWTMQLSRGQLSSLDQLDPYGEIRRTTLSLTYNHEFGAGHWQSILAWGRNSGGQRESTTGYLLETTFNVANQHAFFGRVEQVGSDDLMRENENMPRGTFKVNKMTVGYSYKIRIAGPTQYDVGAMVSRHNLPTVAMDAYGGDRISYLMFMRLRLP